MTDTVYSQAAMSRIGMARSVNQVSVAPPPAAGSPPVGLASRGVGDGIAMLRATGMLRDMEGCMEACRAACLDGDGEEDEGEREEDDAGGRTEDDGRRYDDDGWSSSSSSSSKLR